MLQAWTCEEVCTTLSEGHYNDDDDVGLSSGTILEFMKGDAEGLPSREQPVKAQLATNISSSPTGCQHLQLPSPG